MNDLNKLFDRENTESDLLNAFTQLQQSDPNLRRKDIADRLGVPEAALLDQQCGVKSLRLNKQFNEIIKQLPSLGYIMTLTRNKAAVHERKGVYSNVKITGPMGLVISDDKKIDLRIILPTWAVGFAVMEDTPKGHRFSLQFFDKSGVSIQKIFLQPDSNPSAYAELVNCFKGEDQQNPLEFVANDQQIEYAIDDQVDVEKLRSDWDNMTDVHQFFGMLKRHKVSREQSFRLVGAQYAEPISPDVLESVLVKASSTQLPLMCFVGNHGNIQIHTGFVNNIKVMGPWLNVLDPEFNLHLLQSEIASGWLIRKPTEDGIVTSLEFYDQEGETVAQFFGVRKEGNPENAEWRKLAESAIELSRDEAKSA